AEYQEPIAAAIGLKDEPGLRSPDALMRQIFEHARQVEYVTSEVFERAIGDSGTEVLGALDRLDAILSSLADCAEAGGGPTVAALDAIEAAAIPDDVVWSDTTRESFLRLVRTGDPGIRLLDALDRLGLLAML